MIIVFGSINLDITFPLEHMPAPGETVLGKTFLINPGGKGANQAVAAALAGSETVMVGCVGNDGFATEAMTILKESNVNLDHVTKAEAPTGCASIWVDAGGENSIAVASGANLSVQADQVPDELLTPDNWLLIQMETPADQNWALIKKAKEKSCKIILNVAPAKYVPQHILDQIDILLVNEGEAKAIADNIGLDSSQLTRLPRFFAQKFQHGCVLTLGGAGSLYFGEEGGVSTPTLPIAPTDTTAAGDTFVGYLAASLDQGYPIEQALRRATVAAGLCCQKAGAQTSIPNEADVIAQLSKLPESKKST